MRRERERERDEGGADQLGGAWVLGALGLGIAVFGIEYAVSPKGQSWLDKISDKLRDMRRDKAMEARALDEARQLGPRRTPVSTTPTMPMAPSVGPAPSPPSSAPAPHFRASPPAPRQRAHFIARPRRVPPQAPYEQHLPDLRAAAESAAGLLNALFGTRLPTDGSMPAEMTAMLRRLQAALHIPETGLPDAATLAALSAPTSPSSSATWPGF